MTYDVTVVREHAELQRVLPEWREFLAARPHGAGFFSEPALVEHAVSRGEVSPHIVFVRRDGILDCIAPLCLQPSTFRLQFSVFQLMSSPVRLMTLCGSDFLFREGADDKICTKLVFESVRRAEFDLGRLESIHAHNRLWQYCVSTNGKPPSLHFSKASRADKAFRLELPPSFSEYVATLGAGTRSTLKRRSKKLLTERAATLVKVTSADQVRPFLRDVNTVFRDSWQAKTYGHSDRDSEAEIARLEHIAKSGWLCCYLLASDAGPVAFQFGYRYGETFYACDFAYAQQWSTYGPGGVLMYLMLEDLYRANPPRVVDLMAGDSPQKQTFRGQPYDVGDFYVVPRNRWRYMIAVQRGLNEIEAFVRGIIVRLRLDKALRRVLKHKR
jgi:CelD/BcsL family acetyltransferase involved in cellulose biosynthesis